MNGEGMSESQIAELLAKDAVFDLIRRTAARLDEEALDQWLELFAADSEYEIKTYGPEINSDMSWWKSDREELARILAEVRDHVRDPGQRLHLVTPISIEFSGDRAAALSHFGILRTTHDGKTGIYAAGRYEDSVIKEYGCWLYECHRVVLDTRMLEPFTHLPL
jgi:3-phenylpropionate/cinnamic acid dioxygenase small subunit